MTTRKGFERSHDWYPVKRGEIWTVGPHVLACGDVEAGDAQRFLERMGITPSMTYVDPPWTPSLLTTFRRKAGFERGQSFETFIRSLATAVLQTAGDIYIEMGRQYLDVLRTTMTKSGVIPSGEWPITYYKKHPAHLVRFGAPSNGVDFTGMDDEDTPWKAISVSSQMDDWIFDPCVGHGLTAEAAHRLDRRFVGMELHPARLAVTIDVLSRMDAGAPRRTGTLERS